MTLTEQQKSVSCSPSDRSYKYFGGIIFVLNILAARVLAQDKLSIQPTLTPEGADFNTLRWRDVSDSLLQLEEEFCSSPRSCDGRMQLLCSFCEFCYCDDYCFVRGDCCLDKLLGTIGDQLVSEPVLQHEASAHFECVDTMLAKTDYYQEFEMVQRMITSCPTYFDSDDDTKGKCENVDNLRDDILSNGTTFQNMTDNWPVASTTSSFFYKNRACAKCHGEVVDDFNLVAWKIRMSCKDMNLATSDLSPKEMLDIVIGKETCTVFLAVPGGFESKKCKLETQESTIYTKCNATGKRTMLDPVLWRACDSHFNSYRNIFCDLCQMDDLRAPESTCGKEAGFSLPFFVLFDPEALQQVKDTQKGRCGCVVDRYFHDTHKDKCRKLSCEHGKRLIDGRCKSDVKAAQGLAYETSLTLSGAVSSEQRKRMGDVVPACGSFRDLYEITKQVVRLFFLYIFKNTDPIVTGFSLVTCSTSPNFPQTANTFSVSFYSLMRVDHLVLAQDVESRLIAINDNHSWNVVVNGVPLELKARYTEPPPAYIIFSGLKSEIRSGQMKNQDHSAWTMVVKKHSKELNPRYTIRNCRDVLHFSGVGSSCYERMLSCHGQHTVMPLEQLTYFAVKNTLTCPRLTFNLSAEGDGIEILVKTEENIVWKAYEIHHSARGDPLSPQDFHVNEEKNVVYVCADAFAKYTPSRKSLNVTSIDIFGVGLVVTSYICLGLSIVTLGLTLLTYALFASLRSLPGKATMAFSGTLLAAIVLFLIGGFVADRRLLCQVVGVATHFSLLSAFTWTVICTVHMYYVFTKLLENNTAEHETKSRFLVYVLISFLVPFIIVSLTITGHSITQATKEEAVMDDTSVEAQLFITCEVPTDWIGYGSGICYLSNKHNLLFAGMVPIILACLINLAVFLRAMIALRRMTSEQKLVRKDTTNNLLIYIKLSSLTDILQESKIPTSLSTCQSTSGLQTYGG
ncbi:uncharacterized protein LOC101856522 isoform X2 [Aplysia californica]|uniref:Uncharacterized protein LOC101856522 isoform X2 n=1 Tax=Aplysia californica TaxID=6500 RepID=A0ABM1VWS5_APLCA|nr:uncharacterized protein LOC101856522 isoform X2 [Aplysia californica]